MINIILILMSIVLLSVFLMIGINSVSTDKIISNNYQKRVNIHFISIENQINDYKKVYNTYPSINNWEDEVYPDFGRKPNIEFGKMFFKENNNSYYLCLNLINNEFNKQLANDAHQKNSSYIIEEKGCTTTDGISITKKI